MKWRVKVPVMCVGHVDTYEVEAATKEDAQRLIEDGDDAAKLIGSEQNTEGCCWEDAIFQLVEESK